MSPFTHKPQTRLPVPCEPPELVPEICAAYIGGTVLHSFGRWQATKRACCMPSERRVTCLPPFQSVKLGFPD